MLFELRSLKKESGNTKISPYTSNKTILKNGCFRVRVSVNYNPKPKPNPNPKPKPNPKPNPKP